MNATVLSGTAILAISICSRDLFCVKHDGSRNERKLCEASMHSMKIDAFRNQCVVPGLVFIYGVNRTLGQEKWKTH